MRRGPGSLPTSPRGERLAPAPLLHRTSRTVPAFGYAGWRRRSLTRVPCRARGRQQHHPPRGLRVDTTVESGKLCCRGVDHVSRSTIAAALSLGKAPRSRSAVSSASYLRFWESRRRARYTSDSGSVRESYRCRLPDASSPWNPWYMLGLTSSGCSTPDHRGRSFGAFHARGRGDGHSPRLSLRRPCCRRELLAPITLTPPSLVPSLNMHGSISRASFRVERRGSSLHQQLVSVPPRSYWV